MSIYVGNEIFREDFDPRCAIMSLLIKLLSVNGFKATKLVDALAQSGTVDDLIDVALIDAHPRDVPARLFVIPLLAELFRLTRETQRARWKKAVLQRPLELARAIPLRLREIIDVFSRLPVDQGEVCISQLFHPSSLIFVM